MMSTFRQKLRLKKKEALCAAKLVKIEDKGHKKHTACAASLPVGKKSSMLFVALIFDFKSTFDLQDLLKI